MTIALSRIARFFPAFALTIVAAAADAGHHEASEAKACPDYMHVELRKLHSKKTVQLCDLYKADKPMLFVNTASKCGYTPQFKELEALYQKYQGKGLTVVGFPSNSFNQESKSEEETASVCYTNYGVTFTMTETVPVKGDDAIPLFKKLADKSSEPKWNFNKYLLVGDKVTRFDSNQKPLGGDIEAQIAAALQ